VLKLALLLAAAAPTVAPTAGAGQPVLCCKATIRVRVPAGTGVVFLSGSLPELGPWRADAVRMSGTGLERTAYVTVPPGTAFEYKFTLGAWNREALTATGTVPPNYQLRVHRDTAVTQRVAGFKPDPRIYIADWRGSGVLGRLVYWTDVQSAFLGPSRHVEVWLPPGYDSAAATRYPVLYMHDGQNLFDPRIANTGVDWAWTRQPCVWPLRASSRRSSWSASGAPTRAARNTHPGITPPTMPGSSSRSSCPGSTGSFAP
jgi:hypothetical protein